MAQVWHDLLFAHWPLPPETLRSLVPQRLELDTYDGQCWVGVVPFWMSGVRPRGIFSVPALSTFPELNARTYVRVGEKPGVYFFSLDAASRLAVWGARTFFHLPYFFSRMSVFHEGESVVYQSQRGAAEFQARYCPAGTTFEAQGNTLEHFLTERYCLYTVNQNSVLRCDIHHAQWQLQRAEAEFTKNAVAQADGLELPLSPPHLLFSRRQDVIIWSLRKLNL